MKYIIGSDIKFIIGFGKLSENAVGATHYKMNDCAGFLKNRKDLTAYKVRSTTKQKDYVVGQVMSCIGKDDNIVLGVDNAKEFDFELDAVKYAIDHQDIVSQLENAYVYGPGVKKYTRVKDAIAISKTILKQKTIDAVDITNDVPVTAAAITKQVAPTKRIVLSPTQRSKIYSKSGKVCAICGKPLSIDDFTVDHIVPLALGGTYDDDNLQATHKKCNLMKADIKEDEFYDLVNTVAENRMMNKFDYNTMLKMSRAMVRGIIRGCV